MKKQTLKERLELYATDKGSKGTSSHALLLTASAVAGVGAILVPPPAEAAIVYSGAQNKEVKDGSKTQFVDFDNDGSGDFRFYWNSDYQFVEKVVGALVVVNTSNQSTSNRPRKMGNDEDISGNNVGTITNGTLAAGSNGFFLGGQGFLGVKFEIGNNTHYGWIQYKANADASVGTIIDWAYEDTPDKAIKAGATTTTTTVDDSDDWLLFLPAIVAGAQK